MIFVLSKNFRAQSSSGDIQEIFSEFHRIITENKFDNLRLVAMDNKISSIRLEKLLQG